MKMHMDRRRFLQCGLLGGAFSAWRAGAGVTRMQGVAVQSTKANDPAMNADRVGLDKSDKYPETAASLTIKDPSSFRVLQITDVHFFGIKSQSARDPETVSDVAKIIELTQPEILLVTGDLWTDNPEGKGEAHMRFGVEKISSLGIPWLFVWGNHDLMNDYTVGHNVFREAKNSLYRGGPGGGNYVVQVLDAQQKPVWRFVCLNSTIKGLQPEQSAWVRALPPELTDAVGTFAVFHIPLQQYEVLWKGKAASGVRFEAICSEDERGQAWSPLRTLKGLKACVCGHDHVNDFSGVYDGVELIYGRATGYGGYGDTLVPKGAKIYTINTQTGDFSWDAIRADGSRWHPKAGEQIDNKKGSPWKK